jgi:hypothetical protein
MPNYVLWLKVVTNTTVLIHVPYVSSYSHVFGLL